MAERAKTGITGIEVQDNAYAILMRQVSHTNVYVDHKARRSQPRSGKYLGVPTSKKETDSKKK